MIYFFHTVFMRGFFEFYIHISNIETNTERMHSTVMPNLSVFNPFLSLDALRYSVPVRE